MISKKQFKMLTSQTTGHFHFLSVHLRGVPARTKSAPFLDVVDKWLSFCTAEF